MVTADSVILPTLRSAAFCDLNSQKRFDFKGVRDTSHLEGLNLQLLEILLSNTLCP